VTWPGATNLDVKANGDITYWMAIAKAISRKRLRTEARGTRFRFGQWHGDWDQLWEPGPIHHAGRPGCSLIPIAHADLRTVRQSAATTRHTDNWGRPSRTSGPIIRYEGGFDGVLAVF